MSIPSSIPISNFLRYWRSTLADEDLMGMSAKGSPVRMTNDVARAGAVDEVSVQKIQEKWKQHRAKATRKDILFAVDDRQQVVDMWRKNGIACFQCDVGDF